MDLRDRITRAIMRAADLCYETSTQKEHWNNLADAALAVFQDTLDNITDTEELSELQRKIAGLLGAE